MSNAKTISRPALNVLRAIDNGDTWRGSWKSIEEITTNGLARFRNLEDVSDPRDTGWELTTKGRDAIAQ